MRAEQTTYRSLSPSTGASRVVQELRAVWPLFVLALLPPLLLQFTLPALLRVPLGLCVVLFAPGFALLTALFRRAEFDLPARLGLSFGLSVATLPVLALVLDALPWGLRPWPMALALSAWIVACIIGTLLRLQFQGTRAEGAFEPPSRPLARWRALGIRRQLLALFGALVLAGVLGAGYSVITAPDPSAQLTEFYALGPEGLAENYPRLVKPNEVMAVQLGISNREGAASRYRVEVRAGDMLLDKRGPIELAAGATWQDTVRYALAKSGDDQQVDILLFRNNDASPYRKLRLWVNVQEANQ